MTCFRRGHSSGCMEQSPQGQSGTGRSAGTVCAGRALLKGRDWRLEVESRDSVPWRGGVFFDSSQVP